MTPYGVARPVLGYPKYSVTHNGDVFRLTSLSPYKRSMPGTTRLIKSRKLKLGVHSRRTVFCTGDKKSHSVSRTVLDAFLGPAPPGTQCCHWDGDITNNRLRNLRWGTPKENMADRDRHGRTARGERHGSATMPHRFKKGRVAS